MSSIAVIEPTMQSACRSRLRSVLYFTFDRLATTLLDLGRRLRSLFLFGLHTFLESLYRRAEVGSEIAQLLSAEDHHHDDQDDKPVPNAEGSHDRSPVLQISQVRGRGSIGPRGSPPHRICAWRCMTSCRPMRPVFTISRNPSGEPCSAANRFATAIILPSAASCSGRAFASVSTCALGITSTWTGATGWMS